MERPWKVGKDAALLDSRMSSSRSIEYHPDGDHTGCQPTCVVCCNSNFFVPLLSEFTNRISRELNLYSSFGRQSQFAAAGLTNDHQHIIPITICLWNVSPRSPAVLHNKGTSRLAMISHTSIGKLAKVHVHRRRGRRDGLRWIAPPAECALGDRDIAKSDSSSEGEGDQLTEGYDWSDFPLPSQATFQHQGGIQANRTPLYPQTIFPFINCTLAIQ